MPRINTLNEDLVSGQESYYLILLTLRGENPVQDPKTKRYRTERYDYHAFFEADRYRTFGSRLHTAVYPAEAKQWKTPKGAHDAMKRLVEKGTIEERHKPKVVKYTRTVIKRFDEVEPETDTTEQPVELTISS